MQTVINTLSSMIIGYAVIFGAMLAYVMSLWLRWRKLSAEEQDLRRAEGQGSPYSSQ